MDNCNRFSTKDTRCAQNQIRNCSAPAWRPRASPATLALPSFSPLLMLFVNSLAPRSLWLSLGERLFLDFILTLCSIRQTALSHQLKLNGRVTPQSLRERESSGKLLFLCVIACDITVRDSPPAAPIRRFWFGFRSSIS